MEQIPWPWAEQEEGDEPPEVALDPQTGEAVVALMASAMVAVVRAAQQVDDDR